MRKERKTRRWLEGKSLSEEKEEKKEREREMKRKKEIDGAYEGDDRLRTTKSVNNTKADCGRG